MLVQLLDFRRSGVECSSQHWRNTGQICPHRRLSSSQPGSSGDAKPARARVADVERCLELF